MQKISEFCCTQGFFSNEGEAEFLWTLPRRPKLPRAFEKINTLLVTRSAAPKERGTSHPTFKKSVVSSCATVCLTVCPSIQLIKSRRSRRLVWWYSYIRFCRRYCVHARRRALEGESVLDDGEGGWLHRRRVLCCCALGHVAQRRKW